VLLIVVASLGLLIQRAQPRVAEPCEVLRPTAEFSVAHIPGAPDLSTNPGAGVWNSANATRIVRDCSRTTDYPDLVTEVRGFWTDTDVYFLFVCCPYQKLYPHREDLRWFRIGSSTDWLEKRNAKSVIWAHDRAAVWGHCREYGRVRPDRAGAESATITRRDVRNGDATRRGVGLGRSCHRLEVGPSDVREHPCPARGECASRDSRRGRTPGGGTTSARSTR
jgi:hypothetical protein